MRGLEKLSVWIQAAMSIIVSFLLATFGAWLTSYSYGNTTATNAANGIGIGNIAYVAIALVVVYPVVVCLSAPVLFRPRYRWAPLLTQICVVLALPITILVPAALFGSIVGGQDANPAYYLVPMLIAAVTSFAIGTFAVGSVMKRADGRLDTGSKPSLPTPDGAEFLLAESYSATNHPRQR